MDLTVTGRHIQVSQQLRERLDDRLDKVAQLAPTIHRVDVVVTHERQARNSESVEVTCYGRGPVIRAEASADDKYAALEAAFDKLTERLRRAADRRRVSRGKRPETGDAPVPSAPVPVADGSDAPDAGGAFGDSPIEVREKVHTSAPMSLEDALNEMELVGHDFYLFHDVETGKPSVLYRRRGWSYGVIHLDLVEPAAAQ
ncbi:MAG: ribosome-associated translation inhibitor RaiA [Dermatophilaceae bacterium]